jgi:LmbE family N-acetylglucosaminyl deacetylase
MSVESTLSLGAPLTAALLVSGLVLSGCSGGSGPEPRTRVAVAPDDRLLVLAPHPDDETLGTGGLIQEALSVGAAVRVVYLTYGDNDEWSFVVYRKTPVIGRGPVARMGEVRRKEALAACDSLGVRAENVVFLGYPDFGTLAIWQQHWGDRPAFRSMLTRATAVPYEDAYRPGALYKGEEILRDLTALLRDFRPTKVMVSHPADQNPDHEALYLFTRVALWDVSGEMKPEILPYLVHYGHWPVPSGYHPGDREEPPDGLALVATWGEVTLSPGMERRKEAALSAHRTQMDYAGRRLRSFIRTSEIFADYPEISLAQGVGIVSLLPHAPHDSTGFPEELTREERAAFVGFEERGVGLDGDTLVVSVTFSRPLSRETTADFQIFGYRNDVPFERMPKLNIGLGVFGERVTDQTQRLPVGIVRIKRDSRHVVVRVPRSVLGEPEKVLLGGRSTMGRVPLDKADWRVVRLPPKA